MPKNLRVFAAPYRVGREIVSGVFLEGCSQPELYSSSEQYTAAIVEAFNQDELKKIVARLRVVRLNQDNERPFHTTQQIRIPTPSDQSGEGCAVEVPAALLREIEDAWEKDGVDNYLVNAVAYAKAHGWTPTKTAG